MIADPKFHNWVASVQFGCSVMSDSLQSHGLQHAMPPCPSPTSRVYSNSCPLSWWCHPTISPFVVPFSSCLLSFPSSGSFPMSQFFASDGQSTRVSASAYTYIKYIHICTYIHTYTHVHTQPPQLGPVSFQHVPLNVYISLLSSPRWSIVITYVSNPGISLFSKDPWSISVENDIYNPRSGHKVCLWLRRCLCF